jgi:spore coat protein U-like protein
MNRLAALLALTLLPLAPHAHAASCTMSATDVVFGNYRVNSDSDVETTSTVSLSCVDDGTGNAVGYSIEISSGGSGDPADRMMGGALHYNLYADFGRTTVWGDGSGGSMAVGGTIAAPGTGLATHTAYGTIPAHQSLQPGNYGDLLTITISY